MTQFIISAITGFLLLFSSVYALVNGKELGGFLLGLSFAGLTLYMFIAQIKMAKNSKYIAFEKIDCAIVFVIFFPVWFTAGYVIFTDKWPLSPLIIAGGIMLFNLFCFTRKR